MTEVINLIPGSNNVFSAIEKALRHKYEQTQAFENCVIVLGYNSFDFFAFKQQHEGKKILIYQLEQLASPDSKWFNASTKNWLRGCDLILEYDLANMEFLSEKGFGEKIVFHPLEYSEANKRELPEEEKIYDILFYGAINKKRADFLNELTGFNICIVGNFNPPEASEGFKHTIIDSKYGDDIWQYINKAKIILNLHYYELGQEQARIYELIINNKCVVSQKSQHNYFKGLISEFTTKQEMKDVLNRLLANDRWKNFDGVGEGFKNRQPVKTVVAVVVYNRYANVERWLNAWVLCIKEDCELVVIHNSDSQIDRVKYKNLCERHGVKYIARANRGFDIGALKDVANNNLPGFPEFDRLLWCTDDTIPMRKGFVIEYTHLLADDTSCVCTEISTEKTTHVRTSGFCLTKNILSKIVFPVVITTKEHCYGFEHGPENNFYQQLEKLGDIILVSELENSPLFDTGYLSTHRPKLDRLQEHQDTFYPLKEKVTFICPVYKSFPSVIASLYMQTHQKWELILIHDGPADETVLNAMKFFTDPRIQFIQTEVRQANWGHGLRQWALNEIKEGRLSDPDYIVITNSDNYHAPPFCEYMIKGFKPGIHATYCSEMVHSYLKWKIIPCRIQRGYVDCAGVMITKEAACAVGWRDTTSHSSDWTYFEDVAKKYGMNSFNKVDGCLLVHN